MTAALRSYQRDGNLSVHCGWAEHRRLLMQLPTGAGKTVSMAALIADILAESPMSRCLYVGDQDELCYQPLAALDKFANVLAALEKGKDRAPLQARVVVGSVQTLSRAGRLERFPSAHFTHLFIDEAHRFVDQKQRVMDHFPSAKVLGVTATPFRKGLADLSDYYEHVAFQMPLMNMIEEGYAPRMRIENFPVEIDLAGAEVGDSDEGKEYTDQSLSTTIAPYYHRICELLVEHARHRRIIVFLPLIDSSKAFASIAREHGILAQHMDGSMSDRHQVLQSFREGRIRMLCNSQVIEVGVDIPEADAILILRPMKSANKYQQMVGRGMRVLPGVIDGIEDKDERKLRIEESAKPECVIFDLLWLHDKLGVANPACLVAEDEAEAKDLAKFAKTVHTAEELEEIRQRILAEKEEGLVKRLEEVALRSVGRFDPLVMAHLTGNNYLLRYEPLMRWEKEPPTPAQLERLVKWGVEISKVTSKGQAAKLMDAMIYRFQNRLATVFQLRALYKVGVKYDPWSLTFLEASCLLDDVKMGGLNHHEQTQKAQANHPF